MVQDTVTFLYFEEVLQHENWVEQVLKHTQITMVDINDL